MSVVSDITNYGTDNTCCKVAEAEHRTTAYSPTTSLLIRHGTMRLRLSALFYIGLLVCTARGAPAQNSEQVSYANYLLDFLLNDLKTYENVDPLPLPDIVRWGGWLHLHSGVLKGLSTIHRLSDARVFANDSISYLHADLGMGSLDMVYTGNVRIFTVGPRVTVLSHVGYTELAIEVIRSADGALGLKDFRLNQLDGFKVHINGLGPLSYLVNSFSNAITSLFKGTLKKRIEERLRRVFISKIKTLPLDF